MSNHDQTIKQPKRQPLEIQFISVNKPDAKKAAKLLGPILYKMFEKQKANEQSKKPLIA